MIGDLLFQFDWLYTLKVKYFKGLLLHVALITGTMILFSWPYLDRAVFWYFLLFLGAAHILQDWIKLKFFDWSKSELIIFLADQALHILAISLLFATSLRLASAPSNETNNAFIGIYNNDILMLYCIALTVASYVGHFVIILSKKDFLGINPAAGTLERGYGFAERCLIVLAFLNNPLWSVPAGAALLLRPAVFNRAKDRFKLSAAFPSRREMLLSASAGVITGLIFFWLMQSI